VGKLNHEGEQDGACIVGAGTLEAGASGNDHELGAHPWLVLVGKMLLRILLAIAALAGAGIAQQPPALPSQTVKRMSETHALKLQLLQAQYQLVMREVCEEAGFPMAECQPRAESGVVIRVPAAAPPGAPESKKPEVAKPDPPKPAALKPSQ